jgi:inactive STAND/Domain of unknown function (DUF4062)
MSALKVFVSATVEDLDRDCRRNAILAIQESNCVAVTMELWNAEYEDAVELCRRRIEKESTHYIGIFAYRRGWVPKRLKGKSITEVEFDIALASSKPLAVFIPKKGSEFALNLAQKSFLKRVEETGACVLFEDLSALGRRVAIRVMLWAHGGLRDLAREATGPAPAQPVMPVPGRKNVNQLGRVAHVRQFQDVMNDSGLPAVAAFLVHGPIGFGQRQLVERLRYEIEQSSTSQPKYCIAAIGAIWRPNSLSQLLEVLGKELDPGWVPASPADIAGRLKDLLNASDIIFEIRNVQRFGGSLPAFIQDFWQPIASTVGRELSHRLVLFLCADQIAAADWEVLLFDSTVNPPEAFDPSRPVKLPALESFTESELITWFRSSCPLSEAKVKAATLMQETDGAPEVVYSKLYE